MATPYAELADLEARFPRALTGDEETAAETLLADASFWLGVWVPGLAEAVDTNEKVATAAKLLVVSMVKRSLLSTVADLPGVQSVSDTAGVFSHSVTYRNPEGNLYLYGSELASLAELLRPCAGSFTAPGL